MIRYRSRPVTIVLPSRRKVAAILALAPPPAVFVPHKRKPRRVIRYALPHKRKRIQAAFIGASHTLSLAQASWAWQPNPILPAKVTQPPVKAWVWQPSAIIETAIMTPPAKPWAWVTNTLISQRTLTLARKAWNWTGNAPAISGVAIVYHVIKRSVGLKAKTRFQD